jgi:hypothetical protein
MLLCQPLGRDVKFLQIPIATCRAPEELPEGILHCLSEASLQNSGSFEERRVVRRTSSVILRGGGHGCPFFWFVFFGQTKKMNSKKSEDQLTNFDGFVTTRKRHYFVIPVETGIQ